MSKMNKKAIIISSLAAAGVLTFSYFAFVKVPTIKYRSYGGSLEKGVMKYNWSGSIGGKKVDFTYQKDTGLHIPNLGLLKNYEADVVFNEQTKQFKITISKGSKVIKEELFKV